MLYLMHEHQQTISLKIHSYNRLDILTIDFVMICRMTAHARSCHEKLLLFQLTSKYKSCTGNDSTPEGEAALPAGAEILNMEISKV